MPRVRRVQSNTIHFNCLLHGLRYHWIVAIRNITSLLHKVHVLSCACNYSQLFSDLWVNTYLDTPVTFYPSGEGGAKSNMQVLHREK